MTQSPKNSFFVELLAVFIGVPLFVVVLFFLADYLPFVGTAWFLFGGCILFYSTWYFVKFYKKNATKTEKGDKGDSEK